VLLSQADFSVASLKSARKWRFPCKTESFSLGRLNPWVDF